MEIPMLVAGGAAIGIIAGFWKYIKHFISKIFSMFIVTIKIEGLMPDAIVSYCSEKLRRLPMGGKTFNSYFEYVKPNRRTERIGYEELSKRNSIFMKGFRPIIVGPPINDDKNKDFNSSINITYIRGTINIDEFLIDAINFANEKTKTGVKERFRIRRLAGSGSIIKRRHGGNNDDQGYPPDAETSGNSDSFVLGDKRLLKWGIQEIGQEVFSDESAFKTLAFPPEVEEFVNEAKKWKESEEWYKEKQIQWRRGWLLHGTPGCVLANTKIKVRKKHNNGKHRIHTINGNLKKTTATEINKRLIGPNVGEIWDIGAYKSMVYVGIGRTFEQRKFLVFKDSDIFFLISKDEFYSENFLFTSNIAKNILTEIKKTRIIPKLKIQEEIELTIEEFFQLAEKGGIYEIDTPQGWIELGDLVKKTNKECFILHTETGRTLEASNDHYIETKLGWEKIEDIDVSNSSVFTNDGKEVVVAKEYIGIHDTFDFEVKSPEHKYYSNGIVSHNTGKTSLVRAIAYDLDLPIYSFDLSTMSNEELIEKWKLMKTYTPCIALIEDIDAVFDGRKNRLGEYGGGLTFDCFLNCIGGIENCNGVMLIVTTNNIEDIDEALGVPRKDKDMNGTLISTRPGRIDRALELKKLTEECRVKIARRILKDYPKYINEVVEKGDGDTGAQFQERCTQIALEKYWINENSRKKEKKL